MDLHAKELKLTRHRIEVLNNLGLFTTEDVLRYYPYRYETLNVKPYADWQLKEKITFEAEVITQIKTWRKGRFTTSSFQVQCESQVLRVTIFNRPWANQLKMNQIITITGIYNGKNNVTAMNYDTRPLTDHQDITPVYTTRQNIRQKTIQQAVHAVLDAVENEIIDEIPETYIQQYALLRKADALRRIHEPSNPKDVQLATRTLKYEEFLRFFVEMELRKRDDQNGIYKLPKQINEKQIQQILQSLPFQLTKGQADAFDDILQDMQDTHPMYRLIQGDVGCGKTVVAALGLYASYLSGYQSALLAPTEILAIQHYHSFQSLIDDQNIRIAVLYSGLKEQEKNRIKQEIANGEIDVVIGTHSLLQEDVVFSRLGFIVADEQQRFGVEQRKILRTKGEAVDFLLMSATPIPRTLAATLFGDMKISTIETLPTGRKEPITRYIHENSFRTVLADVNQLLTSGQQLYVICAAVEENELFHARNVQDTQAALQKQFPSYQVGILYGRMSSQEKQDVMQAFADNQIQILVSTTVVEVGMNVVNATGMIIYDADRFGLSQLHQLRGRIQRGQHVGQCWLLSSSQEPATMERLQVLEKTNNGFEISYEDLRLRGPGDILGTRQSGVPDFILGNLVTDTKIIDTAKKDAAAIVSHPDYPQFAYILDSVKEASDTRYSHLD